MAGIAELIKPLSFSGEQIYFEICKVTAINETDRTCDVKPLAEKAELKGIRMQASLELENGMYVKPVLNSYVLVGFTSKDKGFISVYSEIDCIKVTTENDFIFNGGELGGLVKIEELKNVLDKIHSILNGFIQTLQTPIMEPGNGAPSAFQTALNTAIGSKQTGSLDNLEDEKVKH